MTQGERIKEIRKSLGLTLEKFGDKIGMKKNSLSQLENGKNSVTEQVIKSICREFQVDYIWLTTGAGEMLIEQQSSDAAALVDRLMSYESEYTKTMFRTFLKLSPEEIKALESIMKKYLEEAKKDSPN